MNQDSPSSIYHQHGMDLLAKRSEELRKAIDAIQQGANADTKSTAGDKHETARAMAQLDIAFDDPSSWGLSLAHAIFPIVCG
ncbi:MAG: hypothetical protein ACKOX7_05595, partial [Bacteroidota bacterium]